MIDSNGLFLFTVFVQGDTPNNTAALICPMAKKCELERVPRTSLVECRPEFYDSCGGAIHYGGVVYCRVLFDRLEAVKVVG